MTMTALRHDLNLARPDDVYNLIVDAHKGLDDAQCRAFDARLILLLLSAITAVYFAIAVRAGTQKVYSSNSAVMLDAARQMERCMEEIKALKERRGIEINPSEDIHGTGLIGTDYTPITTTLGSLEAKRTTANP